MCVRLDDTKYKRGEYPADLTGGRIDDRNVWCLKEKTNTHMVGQAFLSDDLFYDTGRNLPSQNITVKTGGETLSKQDYA